VRCCDRLISKRIYSSTFATNDTRVCDIMAIRPHLAGAGCSSMPSTAADVPAQMATELHWCRL
ncbi:hypothetical protein, partial [Enterobacter cloacae]|uniref:hypothetical protein n=1 Tax=Enterobacter cloacae TaxID=550 RepID=UPI001953BECB